MNHRASIYTNPLIPGNLYYSKVLDLHVESGASSYIWARLLTGPGYGEYAGTRLASIIYRTAKSEELLTKFRQTFRIADSEATESWLEAIRRWGCISVVPAEYQCQLYSAIVYVSQNANMLKTSMQLKEREQIEGGIEWPDHVDSPPARPKPVLLPSPERPQHREISLKNGWRVVF